MATCEYQFRSSKNKSLSSSSITERFNVAWHRSHPRRRSPPVGSFPTRKTTLSEIGINAARRLRHVKGNRKQYNVSHNPTMPHLGMTPVEQDLTPFWNTGVESTRFCSGANFTRGKHFPTQGCNEHNQHFFYVQSLLPGPHQ